MEPIKNETYMTNMKLAADYQVKAMFTNDKILRRAMKKKVREHYQIAFASLTEDEIAKLIPKDPEPKTPTIDELTEVKEEKTVEENL